MVLWVSLLVLSSPSWLQVWLSVHPASLAVHGRCGGWAPSRTHAAGCLRASTLSVVFASLVYFLRWASLCFNASQRRRTCAPSSHWTVSFRCSLCIPAVPPRSIGAVWSCAASRVGAGRTGVMQRGGLHSMRADDLQRALTAFGTAAALWQPRRRA